MVNGRIAIIPARGGSKRIPRKNIVDFLGKPIIAWTIDAARQSGCFDRVLVSTDDPEIAQVAREHGAEAPFLRARHANDTSPSSLATIAALQQAQTYWNETYGLVAQLMPNCPLRGKQEIQAAVVTFERSAAEFQVSCFKFGWMNPWWATQLDIDGRPTRLLDQQAARSQDLPALYCPTGAIWLAQAVQLLEAGTFYGPDHRYAPMEWTAAIDIDDLEDLEMARAVALMRQARMASGV